MIITCGHRAAACAGHGAEFVSLASLLLSVHAPAEALRRAYARHVLPADFRLQLVHNIAADERADAGSTDAAVLLEAATKRDTAVLAVLLAEPEACR